LGAVQGIAELITKPGLINVDFADVRTVMSEMGMAMMGTANASGENRARIAAEAAISSPLLEDVDFSDAGGVLVNITAGPDMSIGEFEEVGEVIRSFTSEEATVVVGTVIDPDLTDELRVTVVVTGLGGKIRSIRRETVALTPQRGGNENIKIDEIVDYSKLDKPTVLRNVAGDIADEVDRLATALDKNIEYLDIPAFLRKEDSNR
jgi:cell division protein FtsZ